MVVLISCQSVIKLNDLLNVYWIAFSFKKWTSCDFCCALVCCKTKEVNRFLNGIGWNFEPCFYSNVNVHCCTFCPFNSLLILLACMLLSEIIVKYCMLQSKNCCSIARIWFLKDLRTVPTIVIAHTFCASPDTRISYRQCLLIQEYVCAV